MTLRKKDRNKITAALIGGMVALYLTYGLSLLIGVERFVYLGFLVFWIMVFLFICVPILDRLIVFFGRKIIERQNKEKS